MPNTKEKIEDEIIDWIALGTDGRLIAFSPENKSADLTVQRKGDYPGKEMFFDIKMFAGNAPDTTGKPENLYFIFVMFDGIKQKIDEKIWLVSAKEKQQMQKEDFINFLIKKLISENKPKPKEGFKIKTY